ncbi:MAG: family 20 glycosylhydrolase [Ignavibacteria bacterium]|nr:family 20 glycosylhydrolase [Ignavibacteria bacterium]
MSRTLIAVSRIVFCILLMTTTPTAASQVIIPSPAHLDKREGLLLIDSSFTVRVNGYTEPRLSSAVERLIARMGDETGIVFYKDQTPENTPTLEIRCARSSSAVPTLGEDESYTLDVTPTLARLESATPYGILRGLETFWQLLFPGPAGFAIPALHIEDSPRFPWRGLLMDVCRHWMPMEVVKRNLDAMAAVKLNVLHWHLSEDQGFRVESNRHPELHRQGSDGKYFTQKEVRQIVAYAADRGIRVVPEFDMPGHTTSWLVGYPGLASAPGPYSIERSWGIFDPTMDPTREETYGFIDGFIEEMATLFPDPYFHIGGDEVNGHQWNDNPDIVSFKHRRGMNDNHDLQAYFNKRLEAILAKHGKRMVGWDEILHPDLPPDIVVQSWRGQNSLAVAARNGYHGILSYGYYLDHMLPASFHYGIDPLGEEAATLDSVSMQRVLGGEACMWSEFVNSANVDSRIWPRVAAIAERLWSPPAVRDTNDMYRRLAVLSSRLEWLGLTHRTGRHMMLERLAGYSDVRPLEILTSILEPVKFYQRPVTRKYTSRTPLNRLVDATLPESRSAREFALSVDSLLLNPDNTRLAARVKTNLQLWHETCSRVRPLVSQSHLLREIDTLITDVQALTVAGLEALDVIGKKPVPDQHHRKEWQQILEHAARPHAELLIMIVEPVRRIVETAVQ